MLFKRLAHGFGAVAVVMLSSGVLVFQSGPAQAADWDTGLKLLTTAGGGVRAASPAVLTEAGAAAAASTVATVTACAATVICGGAMVAVGVGILAYTTRDYWVPWIQSWGTGGGSGSSFGTVSELRWDQSTIGELGAVDGHSTIRAYELTPAVGEAVDSLTYWGTYRDSGGQTQVFPAQYAGGHIKPNNWPAGTEWWSWATPVLPSGSSWLTLVASASDGALLNWSAAGSGFNASDSMTTTNKVCQRPDGSTYTDSRSISSATTSIPWGFCLPGDKAVSLSTVVTPLGGAPQTVQAINLAPSPAEATQYPLCASAGCEYQILIDGVPCRVGQPGCSEWYVMSQATPLRITGRYGQYQYDVTKLRWLEHAYDTPTGVAVTTTTGTASDPTSKPDPLAGVPGVAPDWFHVPQPLDSTAPLPNPKPNPQNTGDCFGGTVSWNPVDWVVTPIKCALAWAFVPSENFLDSWSGNFHAGWEASSPGLWINSVGAIAPNIPSGGCRGPALPTGFLGSATPGGDMFHNGRGPVLPTEIYPFDACSGVMATAAATSKMILTAGIAFYGGMKVVRQLGYAFGFQVHVGSERDTFT